MILRRNNKGTIINVDGIDLSVLFLVAFISKVEFSGIDFTMEIRSLLFIFWLVMSVYDSYFYREDRN